MYLDTLALMDVSGILKWHFGYCPYIIENVMSTESSMIQTQDATQSYNPDAEMRHSPTILRHPTQEAQQIIKLLCLCGLIINPLAL